MKNILKKDAGFTLIELMVVVAIIGILSAIAVPNFKKYQAKSKQSESKIQLAAVYSVEIGSMADYDSYATCLDQLGYDVSPRGYYLIGFVSPETTNVNQRNNNCTNATYYWAPPSPYHLKSGASVPGIAQLPNATIPVDGTTFKAGAVGNISGTDYDTWTITQDKTLNNDHRGY